jgi:hypothetical protein
MVSFLHMIKRIFLDQRDLTSVSANGNKAGHAQKVT